jgi:hypothetical protein
MKGKIDKHGNLWIERKGEWVKQQCMITKKFYPTLLHPYRTMAICCNHTCPLFGEPTFEYDTEFDNGKWIRTGTTFYELMLYKNKVLNFAEFIDERINPELLEVKE